MAKAIMITWLRPSSMARLAIGSCTLVRSWRVVQPKDVPTSVATTGTLRRPWLVRRTAGATAKMTVATIAAGVRMPKMTTAGSRYT